MRSESRPREPPRGQQLHAALEEPGEHRGAAAQLVAGLPGLRLAAAEVPGARGLALPGDAARRVGARAKGRVARSV